VIHVRIKMSFQRSRRPKLCS